MKNTKNFLVTDIATQAARVYVREVVNWFKARGLKSEHALISAAGQLNLSHDFVFRLYYNTRHWPLSADKLRQIECNYLGALDREIAFLIDRTEELRQKKQQIGSVGCQSMDTSSDSPSNNGTGRSVAGI